MPIVLNILVMFLVPHIVKLLRTVPGINNKYSISDTVQN